MPEGIVSDAKRTLHRLLLADMRSELDATLKACAKSAAAADKGQGSAGQRLASLKLALDKADVVLELEEEEGRRLEAEAGAAGGGAAGAAGGGAPPEPASPVSGASPLARMDTGASQDLTAATLDSELTEVSGQRAVRWGMLCHRGSCSRLLW